MKLLRKWMVIPIALLFLVGIIAYKLFYLEKRIALASGNYFTHAYQISHEAHSFLDEKKYFPNSLKAIAEFKENSALNVHNNIALYEEKKKNNYNEYEENSFGFRYDPLVKYIDKGPRSSVVFFQSKSWCAYRFISSEDEEKYFTGLADKKTSVIDPVYNPSLVYACRYYDKDLNQFFTIRAGSSTSRVVSPDLMNDIFPEYVVYEKKVKSKRL